LLFNSFIILEGVVVVVVVAAVAVVLYFIGFFVSLMTDINQ
jgi:hypothetical protein